MATRSTGQTTGQGLQSDVQYRRGNPAFDNLPQSPLDKISDRIPQKANLMSKEEYDSMPKDYKATIDGKKFVLVMDSRGGAALAPWIERDARIPKGKSAWDIGRDEGRQYGLDDEALQNAQRLEAGGLGNGLLTVNSSMGDPEFGGFKVRYPDAYQQAYDSFLIDSRNPKSVKLAAVEALDKLSRKNIDGMSSTQIQTAVTEYVQDKLGAKFKGRVKWNMKSYPD